MEDELMTIQETAKFLKSSEGHVYSLMRQGKLPAVKVGAKFTRIQKSDLIAFLEKHKTEIPSGEEDQG